jgi:hypothetical protein
MKFLEIESVKFSFMQTNHKLMHTFESNFSITNGKVLNIIIALMGCFYNKFYLCLVSQFFHFIFFIFFVPEAF